MLIAPSSEKRLWITIESERHAAFTGGGAKPKIAIDLTDAVDRWEFQAGFAGVNEELQRTGANYCVVSDFLCRLQIPFEARVVEELHRANVGKAFAACCVADELP